MNSPNISHYPLNRQGALELGESPCEQCYFGYSNYSNGICTCCETSCEYLRIFCDKEKMEQIKLKGVKND